MQTLNIINVYQNYSFQWPGGDTEKFEIAVTYEAISGVGRHKVTIGTGSLATA